MSGVGETLKAIGAAMSPDNPGGEPSEGAVEAAEKEWIARNMPFGSLDALRRTMRACLARAYAVDFPKPEGATAPEPVPATIAGRASSGPSLSEGELDRLESEASYARHNVIQNIRHGGRERHDDTVDYLAAAVLRLIAFIRASKVPPAPSASSGPIPTEADLERLETIRAAATPGPWWSDWSAVYGGPSNHTIVYKMGTGGPDTAFIAAFNPQAMAPVLSLAREGLRGRPEGWELVPIEATHEMREAGILAANKGTEHEGYLNGYSRMAPAWHAMIAAAPPAPGGK